MLVADKWEAVRGLISFPILNHGVARRGLSGHYWLWGFWGESNFRSTANNQMGGKSLLFTPGPAAYNATEESKARSQGETYCVQTDRTRPYRRSLRHDALELRPPPTSPPP